MGSIKLCFFFPCLLHFVSGSGLGARGLSGSVLLFPVPAALGCASLLHFAFLGVQVPGAKVLSSGPPRKSVLKRSKCAASKS